MTVPYDPENGWIRKGPNLPEESVNMAYVDTPDLSPEEYIKIIDESINELANLYTESNRIKLMWSGIDGCLEDNDGLQIVEDEYPAVTDKFYGGYATQENILPYTYVSRYYHLDSNGLAIPPAGEEAAKLILYQGKKITIQDENGEEYHGKFQIEIAFVEDLGSQAAYRIHVYLDDIPSRRYYLLYNMTDLGEGSPDPSWRETIAPQPCFHRSFDLNEVLDPQKEGDPLFYIEHSETSSEAGAVMEEGGKIFVTKKALPDKRRYQFFHWRVRGDFTLATPSERQFTPNDFGTINAGYLVKGRKLPGNRYPSDPLEADHFCFFNLANWGGNPGIVFNNPLHPRKSRTTRDHWEVNLSDVSKEQIKQFDILVFSTHATDFSFSATDKEKLLTFIDSGGLLFIEDCGGGKITWDNQVENSDPVYCAEGCYTTSAQSMTPGPIYMEPTMEGGGVDIEVLHDDEDNFVHKIIDARRWGGYLISDAEVRKMGDKHHHYWSQVWYPSRRGVIAYLVDSGDKPNPCDGVDNWYALVGSPGSPKRVAMAIKDYPHRRGYVVMSTLDILCGCNDLWEDYETGEQEHWLNNGETICWDQVPRESYFNYLRKNWAEYSLQMLFNLSLFACANRVAGKEGQGGSHTTRAIVYSPWKPSWTIRGDALEEFPLPNEKLAYNFFLHEDDTDETPSEPVWARAIAATGWEEDGRPDSPTIKDIVWKELKRHRGHPVVKSPQFWEDTYTMEVSNPRVQVPDTSETGNLIPCAWTDEPTEYFKRGIDYPLNYKVKSREVKATDKGWQGSYTNSIARTLNFSFKVNSRVVDPDRLRRYSWETSGTAQTYYAEENLNDLIEDISVLTLDSTSRFAYMNTMQISRVTPGQKDQIVPYIQDGFNHMIWKKENPWTGAPADHCPITGVFDATTQSFVQAFENSYFDALNLTKSGGTVIDGALLEAIMRSLVCTNVYGVEQSAAGNHFYDNEYTMVTPFRGFHGAYDDWRQAIPADYLDTAHEGHPFEVIHDAYSTPLNMIEDWQSGGQYKMFGMRTDLTYTGEYFCDSMRITFSEAVRLRKIKIKPYLPASLGNMMLDINRITLIRTGIGPDVTVFQTPPALYTMRGDNPIEIELAAYGNYWDVVGVDIGITSHNPVNGTNCFLWSIANLEFWGPVSLDETVAITDSGYIQLYTGQHTTIQCVPKVDGDIQKYVRRVNWTTVNSGEAPAGYSVSINAAGKLLIDATDASTSSGLAVNGSVSAQDGIKILRAASGQPVAFYNQLPTDIKDGTDEGNAVTFWVNPVDVPQEVQVGFYDTKARTWVTNLDGKPCISWGEVLDRGSSKGVYNVKLAAQVIDCPGAYEQITEGLPSFDTGLVTVPFRWAMPPFGLAKEIGSRITVKPLPAALGRDDIWAVPITRGHFKTQINVKALSDLGVDIQLPNNIFLDPMTYPIVTAHYNISEADRMVWSTIFGEPYWDIKYETPRILDNYTIQIKYPPIHAAVMEDAVTPKDIEEIIPTDTFTPAFTDAGGDPAIEVYNESTSSWDQLSWNNIDDYDLQNGIIYLRTHGGSPLAPIIGQTKVRISYVSANKNYLFRYNDSQFLDLNPMYGHRCQISDEEIDTLMLINRPLYIYLLPALLSWNGPYQPADISYSHLDGYHLHSYTVPGSYRDWTVYITTNRHVFDPDSHDWNPLAILLATIYINPQVTVDDIAILDARKRGGGFSDRLTLAECKALYGEADACWDIGYLVGETYPKNANVTIRLPGWVEHYFTSAEVGSIINKLVPTGILWRVEYWYGEEE